MKTKIRVLIVEDDAEDAELIVCELRRTGYDPEWERAANEATYLEGLSKAPDIIISDFEIPGFSGLRALELLHERGMDIPFIVISGTSGEDIAVEVMRKGAADYLIKDRLARLGQAVAQALEKALLRQARKKAEAHTKLLENCISRLNDIVLITEAEPLGDPGPRILFVNEAFVRRTGYTREEVIGRSPRILQGPKTSRAELDRIGAELRKWKPVRCELINYTKSGEEFWIEMDIVPVADDKGWFTHWVASERDITGRKRDEGRFRRLVDSNAQGVMFWNITGEITGANDAFLRLIGYSREDLEGGLINWILLTPTEDVHLDHLALRELALTGICAPYEKEYIRKDGSRVPLLIGVAAFEDDPDKGVSFTLDLTERKKLEQQFLRAQRMDSIGTLAGGIAHDLNNVLTPIMMSIDLLRSHIVNPSGLEILDIVSKSAERGANMVSQVLSFARGVEGSVLEVQVSIVIGEIVRIVEETFPKNILIEPLVEEDLWPVKGDPTQIHQVLLNLCLNARDAMSGGGTITLKAENLLIDEQYAGMKIEAKPGPYLRIEVEDTGHGIPREIMDKLFDPFFTTKEIGKGTGLGLSSSLTIIKSLGGFIRVYSDVGMGARFRIYLPATMVHGKPSSQNAVLEKPRGNGETILVVDDEESIRQVTQQSLETFGYKVMLAADGSEAVSIYAKNQDQIALVLTDMMMPVMDGPATIQVLRRMNPSVKIIGASGISASEKVTKNTNTEIEDFLPKPYSAETLLNAIHRVLTESDR